MSRKPQTSTSENDLVFRKVVVPGVLSVEANTARIPGYALSVSRLQQADADRCEEDSILVVRYRVSAGPYKGIHSKGKAYVRQEIGSEIRMPVRGFGTLTCAVRPDGRSPSIEVNRFYHRAARLTIGNIHSPGWLLRDLTNIHLINNGYCLLHAAALNCGPRTVVALGLSNTGKTTTALDLTLRGPCKLYGDDLVVVDGSRVYACPEAGTNVSPRHMPTFRKRVAHWACRTIPFFENYGPNASLPIRSFVGESNMADPTPVTTLLALRPAQTNRTRSIGDSETLDLLLASNRAEFTFMNSALFSANDYIHGSRHVDNAICSERAILGKLASTTETLLVEGTIDYFRYVITEALNADTPTG